MPNTAGRLPGVEITDEVRRYGVYDQGAHAWAWQPEGHRPVLWMSRKSAFEEGNPIRGGVPICFPWFGPGRDGNQQPAHGFARISTWERVGEQRANGTLQVTYRLDETVSGDQPQWPHPYRAEYTVTFDATELTLELTVTNTGEEAITYEEALHTYLAVGNVREVSIDGLAGSRYLDKVAGEWREQDGVVTISEETDRVYLSDAALTLHDPVLERTLTIAKEGSATTVVWNPWIDKAEAMPDFGDDEWPGMICIEAANALDDAVTLEPGASHTLVQRITVS